MTRYALALMPLLLSSPERARDRTYTLAGEGYLDPAGPGRRVPVREVRLRLREDGAFVATLLARGERIDVRGTWDARGRGNVDRLDIHDAFGQRATGTGSLHYRRRGDARAERLFLEGRTRQGGFRVDMRAAGAEGWDRRGRDDRRSPRDETWDIGGWGRGRLPLPGRTTIESAVRGSGSLSQDVGPSLAFDRARVAFTPGRDGEVVMEGRGQSVRFQGPWFVEHADVVTMDVRQINEMRARGTLEVRLDREVVESVWSEGRTDRGSMTLTFRAR